MNGDSYPARDGEPVTQGHADYCRDFGHATWTRDGVNIGACPRCGDIYEIEQGPGSMPADGMDLAPDTVDTTAEQPSMLHEDIGMIPDPERDATNAETLRALADGPAWATYSGSLEAARDALVHLGCDPGVLARAYALATEQATADTSLVMPTLDSVIAGTSAEYGGRNGALITCADGFIVAVIAHAGVYSTPRNDVAPVGGYTEVEVRAFAGLIDWHIGVEPGSHDSPRPVYPYVPVADVRALIASHGGEAPRS